jgi:hypothetical protein
LRASIAPHHRSPANGKKPAGQESSTSLTARYATDSNARFRLQSQSFLSNLLAQWRMRCPMESRHRADIPKPLWMTH